MKTLLKSLSVGLGVSSGVLLAIALSVLSLCATCLILTSLVTSASTQSLSTVPPISVTEGVVTQNNERQPTSTPRPTGTPRPTSTPAFGSLQLPVSFGDTVLITSGLDKSQISIKVVNVTRGAAAWDIVYASNMFNDPPQDGLEYIVFDVLVGYVKGDETLSISEYDFGTLSNKRILDFEYSGCCSDELELVEGGEGILTFFMQVYVNDSDPLLFYEPLFSDKKLYFKTK